MHFSKREEFNFLTFSWPPILKTLDVLLTYGKLKSLINFAKIFKNTSTFFPRKIVRGEEAKFQKHCAIDDKKSIYS